VPSSCPRSSLPADVLAWLAARLVYLLPSWPPGQAAPVGDRRTIDRLTDAQRAYNRAQAGLRALV